MRSPSKLSCASPTGDLDSFINGNIGSMIDALIANHQAELLNRQG